VSWQEEEFSTDTHTTFLCKDELHNTGAAAVLVSSVKEHVDHIDTAVINWRYNIVEMHLIVVEVFEN